ncbi:hypothetical protein GOP47_0029824 [Adiantum capillus-veneris]|nr:hypothetical protein GOP47_0029824 [Adiantum capillus-veneris]
MNQSVAQCFLQFHEALSSHGEGVRKQVEKVTSKGERNEACPSEDIRHQKASKHVDHLRLMSLLSNALTPWEDAFQHTKFVYKRQGRVKGSEQGSNRAPQADSSNHGSSGRVYASGDEVWFDSQLWLDSDSDDDFRSVNGDSLPRLGNTFDQFASIQSSPQTFASLKERIQSSPVETSVQSSPLETTVADPQVDVTSPSDKRMLAEFLCQMSPGDERYSLVNGSHQRGIDKGYEHQDNSSHLSCLPRLLPSVSFNDKKAPISPGLQKAKNALLHFPFKRRSNDFLDATNPFTSSVRVERPIAGSQVPFCSGDKLMEGTWSVVGPSTFKLRGSGYLRDKIKIFASEHSMYEPFGVDVFISPKKISHIARYVELPVCNKVGDLPSLLILNIQIPMYPAAIFLNEVDGEGLSLVFYHKLSEKQAMVPSYFQEMFLKVLNDEVERVRGFAGDFSLPFRERLKILGRVVNPEELHLSVAERKVVYAYNEKPVLSRPQHTFYQGDSYFEVDLDMHRFSYLARKGVESFRERLKLCILDLGLTIQLNG